MHRGFIRSNAYTRLAALAALSALALPDLCTQLQTRLNDRSGSGVISLAEWEVLMALCDATGVPAVASNPPADCSRVARRLSQYLIKAAQFRFSHAVYVYISPGTAPWCELARKVSTALVHLALVGEKSLVDDVVHTFTQFLELLFAPRAPLGPQHYQALMGVIQAFQVQPRFFTRSDASFKVFYLVERCVDDAELMQGAETHAMAAASADTIAPIAFIQALALLMAAICSSVVGDDDNALMAHVLLRVAAGEAFGAKINSYLPAGAAEDVPSSPAYVHSNITQLSVVSGTNGLATTQRSALDFSDAQVDVLRCFSAMALKKLELLDRGEPYIVYSTMARLKQGYGAKSSLLAVVACGMAAGLVAVETGKRFFNSAVRIYDTMLDAHMSVSVLQLGAILVFKDTAIGSSLTRAFTSLVANPRLSSEQCQAMSQSVGLAGRVLTQDAVVTIIYALSNQLLSDALQLLVRSRSGGPGSPVPLVRENSRSSGACNDAECRKVCVNAVTAISELVGACQDESVSVLAATLLSQKVLKIRASLAPALLDGLVACVAHLPQKEFVVVVRLLHRLTLDADSRGDTEILSALCDARVRLAQRLAPGSELHGVYLVEVLQAIVARGDVQVLDHHRLHDEINAVGDQIALFLRPLAALFPEVRHGPASWAVHDAQTLLLFRNMWFNMVVHGFSARATHLRTYAVELERIAYSTPPLVLDLGSARTETSFELNTVLRRGSSNHNVREHRALVEDALDAPRALLQSKLMFLAAALYVELLRVRHGDCHTVLTYLTDPCVRAGGMERALALLARRVLADFVARVHCGTARQFCAENIAAQLTAMLTQCCAALEPLQAAAFSACGQLVAAVPSALCHRRSLFALFDLLTLLYDSVVDAETRQYNPAFVFCAPSSGIVLRLPDLYAWRRATLARFHSEALLWVRRLLEQCNFDTRSLIQAYVAGLGHFHGAHSVQFGVSFALEMAGLVSGDRELVHLPPAARGAPANLLPPVVLQLTWRLCFVTDLSDRVPLHTREGRAAALADLRRRVHALQAQFPVAPVADVTDVLSEVAGYALVQQEHEAELVRYLVQLPFQGFEARCMRACTGIWSAVLKERPKFSALIIAEITRCWEMSARRRQGLFLRAHDLADVEYGQMKFLPSDSECAHAAAAKVHRAFVPHREIVRLLASNFAATMNQSDHLLCMFTRFVVVGLRCICTGSLHPFARLVRFELVRFAFDVLDHQTKLGSRSVLLLATLIFDAALSWFHARARFPFGGNVLKIRADHALLQEVARLAAAVETRDTRLAVKQALLAFFLGDEIARIGVWLACTASPKTSGQPRDIEQLVAFAYAEDPQLGLALARRCRLPSVDAALLRLLRADPVPALPYADAVQHFLGGAPLHRLLFWRALAPVDAIALFLPPLGTCLYTLQYAVRSLEHHDVNRTFFYVPQIVQLLRHDAQGYVQKFILETARVLQLFAHQIIWNMLANSYRDEEATQPDALKPRLDSVHALMLGALSDVHLDFYEREFGFFADVTAISGKLKPYIRRSKAEKKTKIDEEMARIALRPGVYLPSNPDGVVVDINRRSGKPLQSHAKAPFMASFKIRRDEDCVNDDGRVVRVPLERWQSAIFKVGDDCRQDVLALQLISVFRSVWLDAGLDLYVFPYRVTATAPGCGVIDVLPNATSRDMLGREAVNGLYEYYTTKFGPESSIEFQQARNNLVRSLAGYSIISYLLQFKDRHNGNIMYDDQGHVLHIDFGFCFDIVPGGVKFEVAPFKLTREMVMVLGGSADTQVFRWFQELCIKGYLACRPYMETIVRCVTPMLESGLPCFKEHTIKKLRKRFVPNKSDRDAAIHFRSLIAKACESYYTTGYDQFQRLTNGIPY